MNKKLIATAIAAALVAPSAFAAEGADGMNYTSASEGFYGTLRVRFDTGGKDSDTPTITTGGTSQIGVAGTLDIGNDLTGFYQWETNVDGGQGAATSLRKKTVGVRGGFGEVKFGSFTDTVIGVSGRTDVTNSVSGKVDLTPNGDYRIDNAVAYSTPDLNGFQASLRLIADNSDQEVFPKGIAGDEAGPTIKVDKNAIDDWAIGASYTIQGFNFGAAYRVDINGTKTVAVDLDSDGVIDAGDSLARYNDRSLWGIGASYGQDNWNLATWYGEAEAAVVGNEDTEYYSAAVDVTIDKVKVYAFTETAENVDGAAGKDNTYSGAGIQYAFTTQSRLWLDYLAQESDTDVTIDDKVIVGLRYDF